MNLRTALVSAPVLLALVLLSTRGREAIARAEYTLRGQLGPDTLGF